MQVIGGGIAVSGDSLLRSGVREVKMYIVHCPMYRANDYISLHHRHHKPTNNGLYSIAVVDAEGVLHGVAIIGRPVARLLDDGKTAEVLRVATDGTRNACSMLYGAAFRAAKGLGFARIFTYTRVDEPGASLKASGWILDDHSIRARSWNTPSRKRQDKTEVVRRQRWVKYFGEKPTPIWPNPNPNPFEQLRLEKVEN